MKIKIGLRWGEYVWGLGILCERGVSIKEGSDDVFESLELTIMFGWLNLDIYFERKMKDEVK